MKKTIWVIEQGSYSDYRVVGVFTSKANATAVVEKIKKNEYLYDEPSIAEWPLDPAVDEINAGMSKFRVLMLNDGFVEDIRRTDTDTYDLAGSAHVWERTKAPAYRGQKDIKDALDATVWATDEQHAIKIVNEMRVQWLATGKWK